MTRTLIRSLGWCVGGTAALAFVAAAATTNPGATTPAKPIEAAPAPRAATNPTVEPGKVQWHASFETAQAAAKQSGKPVLLFHMMGALDKQFC